MYMIDFVVLICLDSCIVKYVMQIYGNSEQRAADVYAL